MNLLGITAVLVLLVGVWAQTNVQLPECDSPQAEEVALVARDHINAQHMHGYKYELNRIEDIRVFNTPMGDSTYVLEIELLETDCHVLDPTPLANCTVRPKALTAIEGDCDVVLKMVEGALAVKAFKCKTQESKEDLCLGCPTLLSLNHTEALDFVRASLVTVNNNTVNETYVLHEIGRMSTQLVSGGPIFSAEYVIVVANCTNDFCVPSQDPTAARGFCLAKGLTATHTVDCKLFPVQMPSGNDTATANPAVGPVVHEHKGTFYRLTTFHNPEMNADLSAESAESAEVLTVALAVVTEAKTAAADPVPDAAHLQNASAHLPDAAPLQNASAPLPGATAHLPNASAPLPGAAPIPDGDSTSASDSSSSMEFLPHVLDVGAVSAAAPTDHIVLMPRCPGRVRLY